MNLFAFLLLAALPPLIPSPEIIAQEKTVAPGRNVRLSIKPIDKLPGLASVAYAWVINPAVEDLDQWPDHSHISFGSGTTNQTYSITVIGSYVFQDESKTVTLIQNVSNIQITVITDPVPPPPPPGPGPSDGKYKLAAFIHDLAKSMPKDQCKALADSLSSIAKKAREGSYASKAALVQETRDAGNRVLGPALDSWKPILDQMAAKLNTLKDELPTPQAASVAYDELATGLYAVAGGK